MSTVFELTTAESDQLKEVLNIGVSHAGTRLSQMAGRRVAISVPLIAIKSVESVSDFVAEIDEVSVAVLLRLSGGVDGYVLLYFPQRAAIHLLYSISGKKVGDIRAFNAFDRSVFQEIGNVLAGGMLTGLSEFLHESLFHSVPDVVIDMSSAMFNSLAATMIANHDEFVSLDVAIEVDHEGSWDDVELDEHEPSVGRMFLFIGPESTARILTMTRSMVP